MASKLRATIGSLTEIVARFWPLSKSPEQVIAEQNARYGPLPDEPESQPTSATDDHSAANEPPGNASG